MDIDKIYEKHIGALKSCHHSYNTLEAAIKAAMLEAVEQSRQVAVIASLPDSKVSKLLSALNDIKNWDDDLEDKWQDPGYRAKSALAEYYEGNDQ